MSISYFTTLYGPPITELDEELFLLFSTPSPTGNLGFLSPVANSLSISVGLREYEIQQSAGILASERKGGTTGAVVWRVTPELGGWLVGGMEMGKKEGMGMGKEKERRKRRRGKKGAERDGDGVLVGEIEDRIRGNPLGHILSGSGRPGNTIIEIGCGISGLLAMSLAPYLTRYVLSDQPYVLKTLRANIDNNSPSLFSPLSTSPSVTFYPLDWETDIPSSSLTGLPDILSFDAMIACDCIYNISLVTPFVETCASICSLRRTDPLYASCSSLSPDTASGAVRNQEAVCLIAQQLRDSTVFEAWLREFHGRFHVWRVPDEMVPEGLRPEAGFAVHVGILR